METLQYRFPGPKEFTEDQSHLFKGRTKEIQYLANLIDLKKTVVLFGKSGSGKSSLLNAGVLKLLRHKNNYEVRVIRLLYKGDVSLQSGEDDNYLVKSVLQNFLLPSSRGTFLQKIPYHSFRLWWHFKQLQIIDKNSKCYLLIFDQFEELGTYKEEMVSEFLNQMNELLNFALSFDFKKILQAALEKDTELFSGEDMDLLYKPIAVKLVVIVKSEKMGLLHAVKNYISDILQNCHELKPLSEEQAKIAIQEPACEDFSGATAPFKFESDAVRGIVEYLQEKSDSTFYESPGIQTSLLQMICSHIEQVIVPDDSDRVITLAELGELGKLTEDYYNGKVNMVVKLFNLDESKGKLIRRFLEDKLVSQHGETLNREPVYEDNFPVEFGFLKEDENKILQQLVDFGILRKDKRMEERKVRYFYEISHEKLLVPIQNNRNKEQQQLKDVSHPKKDEPMIVKRGQEDVAFNLPEASITPESTLKSNDAYAYTRKGNEFSYAGDYSKAIEYFTTSINIDPKYFHTYYLRGSAYFNNKNYEKALQDFVHTLELNETYYDSYNEIGRCYLQLKRYQEGADNFRKVIEHNSKADYAYNNLGLALLNMEKYEESVAEFNNALGINPDFSSSYQNRGIALGLLRKYPEAIQDFNTLERLEPGTSNPYYSRGICYYEMGNDTVDADAAVAKQYYEKSIIELSQAVVLKSDDSQARYYLGLAYEKLADWNKAFQQFAELTKAFPDYTDAWYRKGLAAYNLKQYQEAITNFSRALELDPENISAYFERGRAFYNLGNDNESIREFSEVLKRNEKYVEAFYNRGLSFYNLNEYTKSISDFTSAITFNSKYGLAYFKRGQAKYSVFQYAAAIEDFNVILKDERSFPKLNVYMGACFSGLKEYDKALAHHLREYELDPKNLWNLQNLGFCYQNIRQPDFKLALHFHLEAHRIEPKDAWNLSNIGFCYQQIDPPDYHEALKFHLLTFELNPTDVWNLTNIGWCYERMDPPNREKALEYYLKVFELNKEDSKAELNVGWGYLVTGDLESARLHLENALHKNEKEFESYMNLGHIELLKKDVQKAKSYYLRRFSASEDKEDFAKTALEDYSAIEHLGLDKKLYEEVIEEVVKSSV